MQSQNPKLKWFKNEPSFNMRVKEQIRYSSYLPKLHNLHRLHRLHVNYLTSLNTNIHGLRPNFKFLLNERKWKR